MFTRIVVALDGSEAAAQALGIALQLARLGNAELGICSVVDPIMMAGTTPPSPAVDIVIRDMEVAARRLVDDATARAQHLGVTASGHVVCGAPAFEILKFARAFGADAIVMGTHGRRGFAHLLMGSVAETVMREAVLPVVIVRARPPSTQEQRGAAAAEQSEPTQHGNRVRARASA